MEITNLLGDKSFPSQLVGYGIKLLIPQGNDDGLIELYCCYGNELDETNPLNNEKKFEIYKLKNQIEFFNAFSGSYNELIRKVIESNQLTQDELNNLFLEIQKTRKQLRLILDLCVSVGLKANILNIEEIPVK